MLASLLSPNWRVVQGGENGARGGVFFAEPCGAVTCLVQRVQGVRLDDHAVEVAKENRQRQEDNVGGIMPEVAQQLHEPACEPPEPQQCKRQQAQPRAERLGGSPAGVCEEQVPRQCARRQRRQEDRVGAPGLLPPDVAFDEEARQVAPPVAARPAQTLQEVLAVVLERRLHLALVVELHLDLPVVRDHPARQEVVVVGRVEPASAPLLVVEGPLEVLVLQDITAVGGSAAGEAWQAAVDGVARAAVKVAALEVDCRQEVPESLAQARVVCPSKPLARPRRSHRWVLEGCEHPGQRLWLPVDVVVGEGRQPRLNLPNASDHL